MTDKNVKIMTSIEFMGRLLEINFNNRLDVYNDGYHQDVSQTFSTLLSPEYARSILQNYNYIHNRRLDNKFTSVNKRNYGLITIGIVPDASVSGGYKIIMPDGQHTLDIIGKGQNEIPCTFRVFQVKDKTGMDRLFSTFDSGRRRYFEQTLSHARKTGAIGDEYPNNDILRRVPGSIEWNRNDFAMKQGNASPNSVKLELIRSDESVKSFCLSIADLIGNTPVGNKLPTKGTISGLFCIYETGDERFSKFCELFWRGQAKDGTTMSARHPIALLRDKLNTRENFKTNETNHIAWLHTAWKSHKRGCEEMSILRDRNLTSEKIASLDW